MNRRLGLRSLLLGFALVSWGCRVGPEHCVPTTEVPPSWCAATDAAIVVNGPVEDCWWNAFADADLARMVWQARGQNLTLQQAAARIDEERAMRDVARGGLFPNVSGVSSYTLSKISNNGNAFGFALDIPPFNFWSAGFDASWEVDLFGRVHRTVEAADADIDASVERHNGLLVTLLGDVAANYVNIRILQERIRFAEENDRLQRETLRITENRFRAGAVSELDVFQAKSNQLRTEAAIPQLRRELEITANRLSVLLGIPPGNLLEQLEQLPIPTPPTVVAIGLPIDLLRRRPDVRAAERDLAALAARIGVAEADLYPRFSLGGTFTVDSTDIDSWFTGDSIAYRVGPNLRWNFLNWGRLLGNVHVQEARWREAAARYRETVLRAFEEVEDGLAAHRTTQESSYSLLEAVDAAQKAAKTAATQYKQGATSFQSLLDAQRFQTEIQDRSVEARGAVVLSVIALYKALGGGWQWPPAPPLTPPARSQPPAQYPQTPAGPPAEDIPPPSVPERLPPVRDDSRPG